MNMPGTINRFLPRITIVIWAIAYLLLCARILVSNGKAHSVYADFSDAGRHWLHSQELYVRGGINEFRYSPLAAALFVPFELLPARLGEFLWRSINFSAFLGGLYACCRAGIPKSLTACQQCAVFLLSIPLAVGSLNNAQSNPLMLGLMLFAIACLQRQRWLSAAIAIAIAMSFKLFPVALGLLLMLRFPWKFGWRFCLAILVAGLLPFAMQRWNYVLHEYQVWFHYLTTEDRQGGPINDWYKDLRALCRVYAIPIRPMTYLIVELIGAAMIAALCLLKRFQKMPAPIWLAFTMSLACCWMVVLGPATESATYILLAPALSWGIVLTSEGQKPKALRLAYACVFALFLAAQLALNAGEAGKYFRNRLQPLPLAGLFLLITVAVDMACVPPEPTRAV